MILCCRIHLFYLLVYPKFLTLYALQVTGTQKPFANQWVSLSTGFTVYWYSSYSFYFKPNFTFEKSKISPWILQSLFLSIKFWKKALIFPLFHSIHLKSQINYSFFSPSLLQNVLRLHWKFLLWFWISGDCGQVRMARPKYQT